MLVNGAGGGVGAIALQVAKACGAEVTGVDGPEKLDMIRSLGADRVIDYTREDFTTGADRYDLVFDVPGNHSFAECRRALTPEGTYVLIGYDHYGAHGRRWLGSVPRMLRLTAMSFFARNLSDPRFSTPSKRESMAVLAGYLESGKLTPVVDRTYPLAEVPAAIRHLTTGETRGKIVVTMSGGAAGD